MKSLILAAALMFGASASAQNGTSQTAGSSALEVSNEDGKLMKVTWYHTNGVVRETGYFLNGEKHGQWMTFDESGKKLSEANYKEGQKDGNWSVWHDNGTVRYHMVYSNNKRIMVTEWDNAGNLIAGVQAK